MRWEPSYVFGVNRAAKSTREIVLIVPATMECRSFLTEHTLRLASLKLPRSMAARTEEEIDDVVSILWLEPSRNAYEALRIAVDAITDGVIPVDPRVWRRLDVAPGAAITCKQCGTPFDLEIGIWLTAEGVAFFQGEMYSMCESCSGGGDVLEADYSSAPTYQLIAGGGVGDAQAVGKLRVVHCEAESSSERFPSTDES